MNCSETQQKAFRGSLSLSDHLSIFIYKSLFQIHLQNLDELRLAMLKQSDAAKTALTPFTLLMVELVFKVPMHQRVIMQQFKKRCFW
mmetsp:Transcript_162758/g.300456  ORF Transcript_162758/g.300456 Transcript_162758/m.300456 type:complete len:87 (+) Transcript_162758:1583-1843(+)